MKQAPLVAHKTSWCDRILNQCQVSWLKSHNQFILINNPVKSIIFSRVFYKKFWLPQTPGPLGPPGLRPFWPPYPKSIVQYEALGKHNSPPYPVLISPLHLQLLRKLHQPARHLWFFGGISTQYFHWESLWLLYGNHTKSMIRFTHFSSLLHPKWLKNTGHRKHTLILCTRIRAASPFITHVNSLCLGYQ